MWAVLRLGRHTAFAAVLVIRTISVIATATGHGPPVGEDLSTSIIRLQLFVAVLTVSVYLLSAVFTERQDAAHALQESEQSYRTLSENLPGIVYRISFYTNGASVRFNEQLRELTGYAGTELECEGACALDAIILGEDRLRARAEIEGAIAARRSFEIEYRITNRDGSTKHFLERGQPVCDSRNTLTSVDGVILDITARKLMESDLLLSQNLDSIGILAGGIAHDFNNILGGVMGNISLVKEGRKRVIPCTTCWTTRRRRRFGQLV